MSFAENTSDNSTHAQVKGTWNIANDLTVKAATNETVKQSARQGHGSIVGGNGIYADNTINGMTEARIDDGATINAKNVELTATNNINTAGFDDDAYTLNDYYGGVVTVDGLSGTLNVDKNADITIKGSGEHVGRSELYNVDGGHFLC